MSGKWRPSFDDPAAVESPFLQHESRAVEPEAAWEPRATTVAEESPFRRTFDSGEPGVTYGEAEWAETEAEDERDASDQDGHGELAPRIEHEPPAAHARPAPNTVDEEAAEPVFPGRIRAPHAPLLDAATLKRSRNWNDATHPKVSGIPLDELRARLERYVDRRALDDLIRQANAGAATPYAGDVATIVTLLAQQFQRKTCRAPSVGSVWKRCTVDGRVAEDTLDALGFVYHTGRGLNTADRANAVAAAALRRVPARAFTGLEPGLAARTWWSYMVSPPWLGMPIKRGIHLVLLKQLRRAQRALMQLPAYADMSPAELGRVLGIEEEHKGARPANTEWSMHLFGLGIDISYTRNPWVSNPKSDTTALKDITLRAARLFGPSGAREGLSARWLHDLAIAHRDTAPIHRQLAESTRWLQEYFALAGDARRIEGLLPVANAIHPDGKWFKPNETLAVAAARWARDIRGDFSTFADAVSREGSKNQVRHGFMDLARDLVIALRDDACLAWGAVDFGPSVSGDIMHFDCRIAGIGRAIARAGGRAFVPTAGHRCLPAAEDREVQGESPRSDRPLVPVTHPRRPHAVVGGRWLTMPSAAIPWYKGPAGKRLGTSSSIYVPDAAWKEKRIDLLVFFHGDPGPCAKTFLPDPRDVGKKFDLDGQVNRSKRKVAVAVPVVHWIVRRSDNVRGIWTAARLNAYVDEVLVEIGAQSGVRPALGRLIIAGHSHAFAILTPLACEFDQDAPATKTGALRTLRRVWALDSTYGPVHVRALEVWARKLPAGEFIAVLDNAGSPLAHWKTYYAANPHCASGFQPPANLKMCSVGDSHCRIPSLYIDPLLSAPRNVPDLCRALAPPGTRP